ncbi:MAG: hypothetical protein QXE84_07520 [Candidatus Nitrosotenuis sp.]|uniref:Uncharacterized protein n=1 Tax=Candidatus Nitrosotenuis uzonensis TaxID=1407055 RepID=A0A812F4M7_9ARCH|nr:hypothetical protein [Candidatus Nitrosotenuis uzonensis]CAE6494924.1 conserved hypothetical protein [Candidatus Nitrosotenuis uzonensis]
MIWPGMGDPSKRKKTLKYLIMTAIVGIGVAAASSGIQVVLNQDNPLKVCINDRDTRFVVTATLEVYVDKQKYPIPAQVGFKEGCQRSLYTLSNDGTIYAAWTEEYPFEIGHFLWMWEFPLRDMQESKSKIFMNGKESADFIRTPLVDGAHYRAEFISKAYDEFQDRDFAPPK